MFTYPYQILEKRIKAMMPELREVDWYLDQDSTKDASTWLYASPTVFFQFDIVEGPKDHGRKIQSALVDITAHLLTDNARERGNQVMQKVTAKDHAILFDKLYRSLTSFSSRLSYLTEFAALLNTDQDRMVMNSLSRVGIVNPHRIRKTMIKSTQRFQCVVWDHAASKIYSKPDPKPSVEIHATIERPDFGFFDDSFDETFA